MRAVPAAYTGQSAIDYAYLLDDRKLAEEKRQALAAGRLKELSPAEMRDLADSYEARRRQRRSEWLEARARYQK